MTTDTSNSPYAKLRSLPIANVQWTEGFWADLFAVCAESMIPNMWHLLDDPSVSHNAENFRVAAGSVPGEHRGPPFGDGDLYKWVEAAAYTYGKTRDPKLDELLDRVIALIGSVQRDDGYIFTKQAIESKNNPTSRALADQLNFEVYNIGHLMTAGCIHFRATGKDALLNVAKRAAAYLESAFASISPENAKTAVCPSHYMGIIELFRTSGDRRYLDLAGKLIRMRDMVKNGTDDNQDRIALKEQRQAVGHAVRANYLYAGVADLYAETGDAELLPVLESCWHDVVFRKMYITGSCGALYDGVSPYGSSDYNEIQRTHQAYGRPYELPNITAYNETCAAVGNILWNWRMLTLSADARYADVIERTLYNGALAGVSLDGTRFFYSNTLRRHRDLPFSLKWSRKREPYISSFCCPPNLVRTIAESTSYAYACKGNDVYAVLYGSSRAEIPIGSGATVTLEQSTDYPWDGLIRFRLAATTVTPEPTATFATTAAPGRRVRFQLHLRIPGWSDHATVRLNDSPLSTTAAVPVPGTFFAIDREWQVGDRVELHLPMRVKTLSAHPLLEETRNHVAVQRGPIVYCVESADLPEGMPISELYFPIDAPGDTSRFREQFLPAFGRAAESGTKNRRSFQRMLVLEADLVRHSEPPWGDDLYREATADSERSRVRTRLIPYFAWDNRDFGEMTVWIPVRGGSAG